MNYFEHMNWEAIRKDLEKGFEKGVGVVKQGARAAQKKAGELTEEGKRQYSLYTLKTKMHRGLSELGARVYVLANTAKNPLLDAQAKSIISRLKKIETKIAGLEAKKPQRTRTQKNRS
ncbi:MAG: hypothetical protein WC539_06985 [Nitrospirota bacterium]